jgi:predicted dithiol-disulfide oxidoreductase (DUF899 family)
MVKVDQEYVFEGPDGKVTLAGLFGDKRQLIVQHVMFGPDWEQPCPGCSASLATLSQAVLDHLATRETAFVLTSRAPYDKIAAKAEERDWSFPWYSSFGSEFNYDYQVTLDASRGLVDYNYRPAPEALSDEQSTGLGRAQGPRRPGPRRRPDLHQLSRNTDRRPPALACPGPGRFRAWYRRPGASVATACPGRGSLQSRA